MNSLDSFATRIDNFNELVGLTTAWLAIIMVMVQFTVVVMRYVFGVGSIMMQEAVIYMHAFLFLIGAGYTLLHGGHVRVDVFYRDAMPRKKAIIDLIGVFVFLVPVCIIILWFTLPYVLNSWAVFEGSKETSGIQGVFILKSTILAFAVLVILQGVSMALRCILTIRGGVPPSASRTEPF